MTQHHTHNTTLAIQLKPTFTFLFILLTLSGCAETKGFLENLEIQRPNSSSKSAVSDLIENRADMEKLQIALNREGKKHGFSVIATDGLFGAKTRNAIKKYQQVNSIAADGKPTYKLLSRLESKGPAEGSRTVVAQGETHSPTSTTRQPNKRVPKVNKPKSAKQPPAAMISHCMDNLSAQERQLIDRALQEVAGSLPIDVRPYLSGLCLPSQIHLLEELYLYMVAHGATHSRLTLVKYETLVDFYEKAGVDLGVRKGAFKRSIDSLRSDYRTLAEDRQKGAEELLSDFEHAEAEKLLNALPAGYEQLEQKYRAEARKLMSTALGNSTSATFFLTRSVAAGKSIMEHVASIKSSPSAKPSNPFKTLLNPGSAQQTISDLKERKRLSALVIEPKDDVKNMLYASTLSVKTLTQDIKDIPPASKKETHKELEELRQQSGVMLNGFEEEFEDEQTEQLDSIDV